MADTQEKEQPKPTVAGTPDKRGHSRRRMMSMAYVELDQDNGGILLNLSETGVAVQSALMLIDKDQRKIRFQLPQTQTWIDTNGRTAWLSESKREAGFEFVELPAEAHAQIRNWLTSDSVERPLENAIDNRFRRNAPEAPSQHQPEPASSVTPPGVIPPVDFTIPRVPEKSPPLAARNFESLRRETNGGSAANNEAPPASTSAFPSAPIPPRPPAPRYPAESARAAEPVYPPQFAHSAPPLHGAPQIHTPAAQPPRTADYSMFGFGAGRTEDVWMPPPPQPRRSLWPVFLLVFCIAILFFAFGAMSGRSFIDRTMAYFDGLRPTTSAPPRIAPPTPAAENNPADSGAANPANGSNSANGAIAPNATGSVPSGSQQGASTQQGADAQQQAAIGSAPQNPAQGGSGATSGAPVATSAGSKGSQAQNSVATTGNPAAKSKRPLASPTDTAKSRRPQSAEEAAAEDTGEPPAEQNTNPPILVNAPQAGTGPFFVTLQQETVTASSMVAISSRRSIEVPPVAGPGASASKRVLVGKLVSYSQPYYPTEARSRRIDGTVELRVSISRHGVITDIQTLSGPPILAAAAVSAVREWRYEPTFVDGDPAVTRADITMVFRLP